MEAKKKVVFIVPQLSQPRCVKRINAFIESGYEVEVFGFDNGLYSDNIKDIKAKVHVNKVDPSKLSIIARIKYIKSIIKQVSQNDVLYIFGIEFALYYMILFKRNRYIYEQADLNYTKFRNKLVVTFFKNLDKYLIKKSIVTVLTSQGFIEYLYKGVKPDNVFILHNKLDKKILDFKMQNKNSSHSGLRFGFVGLIRYPRTILNFAEVIGESFPQHEFHFWGDGSSYEDAVKLSEEYKNIFSNGNFKSPDDLVDIYKKIDYSIVCYDPNYLNVRIAEPNKLYESIYFKTPIIVSKNTFLEQRVKELGVGFSVDAFDKNAVIELVSFLEIKSKSNIIIDGINRINKNNLISSHDDFFKLIDDIL